MRHRVGWSARLSLCATMLLAGEPPPARAQADRERAGSAADEAAAEVLFQEGRTLLEQKRPAEACPKLAESFRLDPATGTLLALAMCHEEEGKLASAWSEYADVAARARREGRADREEAALLWKQRLERRLSSLTVVVPQAVAGTPGLVVERDGTKLEPPVWSTAVPIDPGVHRIAAVAPNKVPWSVEVTIGAAADRRVVTLPPMRDAPANARVLTASGPGSERSARLDLTARPAERGDGEHPRPAPPAFYRRWWFWVGVGIAVAGALAAGAAAGGLFTEVRDASCPDMRICNELEEP